MQTSPRDAGYLPSQQAPAHPAPALYRIVIVGTCGSGKSTLGCQLAAHLGLSAIELDALFWGPDWTPTPLALFHERVMNALGTGGWVVDGNYSKVRDAIWSQADTVIWLDYSLWWVILPRLLRRICVRIWTRQELWNGNRETLRSSVFARDGILMQAFHTHKKLRGRYPVLMQQPAYAHLRFIHLRSPRETHVWLASLPLVEDRVTGDSAQ